MSDKNYITTLTGKKIFYNKIYGIEAAELVKEELDKNVNLYNALLYEYNAIAIGECLGADGKVLKIEKLRKPKKDKNYICVDDYVKKLIDSISSQYTNPYSKQILEKRIIYQFAPEIQGYEHLLYSAVIEQKGNLDSYTEYLYMIKDYDGIKLLCQSSDVREFEKKYLFNNLEKLLNKSFDLFIDKSEDNFLVKNISLITEAINFTGTEENFSQALWYNELCNIERKIKRNEMDDLNKQKCFESIKKVMNDAEMPQFIKRKCQSIIEEKNMYINDKEIIRLVKEFLSSIDEDGELENFFEKKIKEGKFILYNDDNIEEKKEEVRNKIPENLQSKISDFFDESSLYVPSVDLCFISMKNKITDVSTIVHEFIHQYRYNKNNHSAYSGEVTSIFFEKLCGEYLINNGWGTYKDEIRDDYTSRIINDCVNNCCELKQYINLLNCKLNKGVISLDDVLSDELAMKLNKLEFEAGMPEVDSVNNIRARKILEAKKVIEKNVKANMESIIKKRALYSYAIGTYIASKYLNNEKVIKGMLELVKRTDVKLENIIGNLDNRNTFDTINVKEEER